MKDLKLPPHSMEAEQCVLGSILLDNDVIDLVFEILEDQDFYYRNHREVFCCIIELYSQGQTADVITVAEALDSKGSEVGLSFLGDLAQNTPSIVNAKAYAQIVKEKSILRSLIKASNETADLAFNPKGAKVEEIISETESKFLSIANNNKNTAKNYFETVDVLKSVVQRVEEAGNSKDGIIGLSTGFVDLDHKTSGFQPGDLIIVAGRPSMGKSTLGMNFVTHISNENNYPAVVFSLEMPKEQLKMRELASIAKADFGRIRNGTITKPQNNDQQDEYNRFIQAIQQQKARNNIIYIDEGGISTQYAKSQLNKVVRKYGGISAVLFDYLQLMDGPGENKTQQVGNISGALKGIAKSFNVPVIALSQLNRSLEQRSNKRPVMSDLRESGAIEQDADLILFIYRDEVYNEMTEHKNIAEVIIGKQRNGPLGTIHLGFEGQYSRFTNLAPSYYGGGYE